jgi:hypothetical protein
MLALCSLHNYCIDKRMEMPGRLHEDNVRNLVSEVKRYRKEEKALHKKTGTCGIVAFEDDRPKDLLNGCNHFIDADRHRLQDHNTPMDRMYDLVCAGNAPERFVECLYLIYS